MKYLLTVVCLLSFQGLLEACESQPESLSTCRENPLLPAFVGSKKMTVQLIWRFYLVAPIDGIQCQQDALNGTSIRYSLRASAPVLHLQVEKS